MRFINLLLTLAMTPVTAPTASCFKSRLDKFTVFNLDWFLCLNFAASLNDFLGVSYCRMSALTRTQTMSLISALLLLFTVCLRYS